MQCSGLADDEQNDKHITDILMIILSDAVQHHSCFVTGKGGRLKRYSTDDDILLPQSYLEKGC